MAAVVEASLQCTGRRQTSHVYPIINTIFATSTKPNIKPGATATGSNRVAISELTPNRLHCNALHT